MTKRRRRLRWILLLSLAVLVAIGTLGGAWMFGMPGRSHEGPLPPLTASQAALREALRADLVALASDIGPRGVYDPVGLARAEAFLLEALGRAGHEPRRHPYVSEGVEVANLDVEIRGAAAPDEIVVVGAHYDTVPRCPGANDNGTGVVATLALARAFAGTTPRRTLRLALFVNEEPPFFQTKAMGSLVYARACRERAENVVGMLSLETIGCYLHEPKSQRYPGLVSLFYPDVGNFVTFVANLGSRRLVRDVVRSFRAHAAFPSEGAAVPSWISGVGWSDHWAFWQAGYPAVMVTDTAPFRYEAYHTTDDTVEQVDLSSLARVVDGLEGVVADLVGLAR